jgi:hypothetical protein
MESVKYFVLSLHRSGTVSTANYLNWLGIPTRHWPTEHRGINLEKKVVGRETDLAYVTDVISPVLQDFQAIADVPIPVLYKELLTRYPSARFILIYRNAFDWVRSVRAHHRYAYEQAGDFEPYPRVLYWHYFDWQPRSFAALTDAQLIWMHSQHTADVLAFFSRQAPTNLGVFDLYDADIGSKIAAFVGVQTQLAFPRCNVNASSG